MEDELIPEAAQSMKSVLQRLNPSYSFYEEGVESVQYKNIVFFEFKSPALDEPVYNRMFFLEVAQRLCLGVFCCPDSIREDWQPIARQIMLSARTMWDKTEKEGATKR
jgi:hypothetical protein